MQSLFAKCFFALFALVLMPFSAFAASADVAHLPGDLSLIWVIPFVCMLLSIALGPILVPHFWHHHYGKVALGWGLAFVIPCFLVFGMEITVYEVVHILVLDYIPFIILLFALFTVAGGIRLKGSLVGTPIVNTAILAIGAAIASLMGTTGAAMLLIRPMLRANAHRKFRVHQIVFFIFLVANVGGSLSPLGDPPLFLGFLKGVSFFWTTTNLLAPMVLICIVLLALYYIIDTVLFAKEGKPIPETTSDEKLGFDGKVNFILLACVVGCVLMSGSWKPVDAEGNPLAVTIYHVDYAYQNMLKDFLLLVIAAVSLKLTTKECRSLNGFNWEPIAEVAKLFVGIFLSMVPALTILKAGEAGGLASVVNLVSNADGSPNNIMYFWVTGTLSAFLDNAPTYLVFFTAAEASALDAATAAGISGVEYLMTTGAITLAAISGGAVFMGAVTYIGNAPNFMVRAIAQDQGVKMPSFFGYMAWSVGILVPIFAVVSFLFFV